jgi:DNA-binding SARP family transcriptional activator
MTTRTRSVVAGLAAIAVLTLVVVGLPVVLVRFGGSPFPRHVGWHAAAAALSSHDDGSLLLGAARDCSWLAWLLFTGCVLTEAQAAIRGGRSPHLPLGGLQGVAAYLVALAALAFTTPSAVTLSAAVAATARPAAAMPAVPLTAPAVRPARAPAVSLDTASQYLTSPSLAEYADTTVPPDTTVQLDTTVPAHPTESDFAAAKVTRIVTVRPGDCLWLLAQRYLGAGDRYPEIARLNYGRDMGQGRVFASASLILPGWHLIVPAPASAADPGQATGRATHLGHPTSDAHYRRRHAAARHHSVVENESADRAEASESSSPVAAAVPANTAAGSAGSHGSAGSAAGSTGAQSGERLPEAAVFVTGALAGAVLTGLARLRRRQRQDRRHGRRIALPADRRVLAAEQRLRSVVPAGLQEAEPLHSLRDALAWLEAGIVSGGQPMPEIVGLHVTPEKLEVLLGSPAAEAPPEPFVISPGRQGMCWELAFPAVADGSDERASLPCHLLPGLVTAGETSEGYLMLDLEALRVTGCDGPPALVNQVVSTVATELATGQWSGWYDLILVGFDELEVLGRAEICTTMDEALSLIESRSATVRRRLEDRAIADLRELRLTESDDEDWGLTVLVSRAEPEPDQLAHLLELAEDGPGGIAAIVSGDPEAPDGRMAPTALQLAPDPQVPDGIIANIVPLQITVRPRALSAADYEAIATLFAVASDLTDVSLTDEPYAVYAAPPLIPHAAAMRPADVLSADVLSADLPAADQSPGEGDSLPGEADSLSGEGDWLTSAERSVPGQASDDGGQGGLPDPEASLRIRVLGPFSVAGSAEPLQPKQAELVLALALAAPAGLSNSALCSLLGADADHPKPGDAVRQIITRTRRRLGRASDGQEFIIHAGNGQYFLHPAASLDLSQFRALVASGQADDLRTAVSMIAGPPFTGSYFWWVDIPLLETVRAEVVDAAETLAEFELATGSPRVAARAARAGLLAESSAEQLWRAVMQAEHAAGNLAGVTEAWRRCLDAIEDITPGGEPHPATEGLYRQLTMSTTRQRASVRG